MWRGRVKSATSRNWNAVIRLPMDGDDWISDSSVYTFEQQPPKMRRSVGAQICRIDRKVVDGDGAASREGSEGDGGELMCPFRSSALVSSVCFPRRRAAFVGEDVEVMVPRGWLRGGNGEVEREESPVVVTDCHSAGPYLGFVSRYLLSASGGMLLPKCGVEGVVTLKML